jgi:hypothetical protein
MESDKKWFKHSVFVAILFVSLGHGFYSGLNASLQAHYWSKLRDFESDMGQNLMKIFDMANDLNQRWYTRHLLKSFPPVVSKILDSNVCLYNSDNGNQKLQLSTSVTWRFEYEPSTKLFYLRTSEKMTYLMGTNQSTAHCQTCREILAVSGVQKSSQNLALQWALVSTDMVKFNIVNWKIQLGLHAGVSTADMAKTVYLDDIMDGWVIDVC